MEQDVFIAPAIFLSHNDTVQISNICIKCVLQPQPGPDAAEPDCGNLVLLCFPHVFHMKVSPL